MHLTSFGRVCEPEMKPHLSLNRERARRENRFFYFKTHDLLGIFVGVLKVNMFWTSYECTQYFLPSVMFIVISMHPVTK